MLRFVCSLLLSFCVLFPVFADSDRYAASSALSENRWVKIRVNETGIYQLSYQQLLEMGFADPAKVSVHGYGGWPLDEDFSKPYVDDVPAVAVWKGTDRLLFYAKGPVKWEYGKLGEVQQSGVSGFIHTNNPYASYGCYFVTDAGSTKTMQTIPSEKEATQRITTFDDYLLHETDQVSVNKSGRDLFGESFYGDVPAFTAGDFSGKTSGMTDEESLAVFRFIARVNSPTEVAMHINGEATASATIYSPRPGGVNAYVTALPVTASGYWTGKKAADFKVKIEYAGKGNKSAYLDYIRLQVKRELKAYDEPYTFFRSLQSRNGASRFLIQEAAANLFVWDVTDGLNPGIMETELSGKELSFSIPGGVLREFVLVRTDRKDFPQPAVVGEVKFQKDLHALPPVDMIIITPPAFKGEATRLAEVHSELKVEIVTPEQIYNEFSSGTPDATAYRRFLKMFYDRDRSSAPKYLLLLGDGAYDNRRLTKEWKNISGENMLLTYQTKESLNDESYVADDYFGLLDDTDRIDNSNSTLDISIGRFPVRTLAEARNAVDKVIDYMNNPYKSAWKNEVCFIGDDGNSVDRFNTDHMTQANGLADIVLKNHPEYIVNKILFDNYKKDLTSGLGTYPDARKLIFDKLKSGLLVLNYTGHGSTRSLSDEQTITDTDVLNATYSHLPLWITASCDFCRFDDVVTSAGEQVFLNKKSGGIALFTTSRVALSGANENINRRFIAKLFQPTNGIYPTLGEVMKDAKNEMGSARKLGFCLMGDPAMRLAYPKLRMRITSVNGEDANADTLMLNALQQVTIEGEVTNEDGSLVSGFDGMMYATILDGKVTKTTLGNNTVTEKDEKGDPVTVIRKISFDDYPSILYKGNHAVTSGKFSFTFNVPATISYSDLNTGKMSLYAADPSTGDEAQGSFTNFKVDGTSDHPIVDTDAPEIRSFYLNDTTFVEGGQVNASPYFVAKLWDRAGIDITGSGVGHDMTLIIDNEFHRNYSLNNYYENIPGSDKEGIVKFSIPQLSSGLHTAEFRVWDILGNSRTVTFTFEVVDGLKPFITRLFATPNPAREQVQFHLSHNRPEARLNVRIQVYDMIGRLQWQYEEAGSSELFKDYTISWDLTNGSGSRLRPGIYLYRAAISTDSSKEATETMKLIILGS